MSACLPWRALERNLGGPEAETRTAPHQGCLLLSAHCRVLLVFKDPLALLERKESEVLEVNLDLLACLDPLASVYVPFSPQPPSSPQCLSACPGFLSSLPTLSAGWTWQPRFPWCRWCGWPQGNPSPLSGHLPYSRP